MLFEIIFEDAELLVINKPAGLVCHPTKTDELSSLISRARLYLGKDSHPQLVNRLDRETSGVTVVAKTAESARQLRRLWEQRQVDKEYLALVRGHVPDDHGIVDAPLGKDLKSRVAIKDCVRPDGLSAKTEYWVLERFANRELPPTPSPLPDPASQSPVIPSSTLLRVHPYTGRKHQIRIHLAHMGYPIVGDKLYGGDEDLYLALVEARLTDEQRVRLVLPNHALHASRVRLVWKQNEQAFEAPAPGWAQSPSR